MLDDIPLSKPDITDAEIEAVVDGQNVVFSDDETVGILADENQPQAAIDDLLVTRRDDINSCYQIGHNGLNQ